VPFFTLISSMNTKIKSFSRSSRMRRLPSQLEEAHPEQVLQA
jgi:hypothetical protein